MKRGKIGDEEIKDVFLTSGNIDRRLAGIIGNGKAIGLIGHSLNFSL